MIGQGKKPLLLSLYFLCLLMLSISNSAIGQYKVGDTVVDFTLTSINGEEISLFDYRGKIIFLNLFATW